MMQKVFYHFAGGKQVGEISRIPADKGDVGQPGLYRPLHGNEGGIGGPLQPHQKHIRFILGSFDGESALSTADFQPQFTAGAEPLPPMAPK